MPARTDEEIEARIDQARGLTDKAEAGGGSDDTADAVYTALRWVLGWEDDPTMDGLLEDTYTD